MSDKAFMKVALITRSTLYSLPGGDTVQVINLVKYLNALGVNASIQLTHEHINYNEFDLLHFFNITRPADILYHTRKTPKPYVASPNLVRYNEYDKKYRKGLPGALFKVLQPNAIEYIKTIARWFNGSDQLQSISYLWKGQKNCITDILKNASLVLPNSEMENVMLSKLYNVQVKYSVIPNGIDTTIFIPDTEAKKDNHLVLCVARIEGIKNQLNLIKALNGSEFTTLLIGSYAANQKSYYGLCKKTAAPNIHFIDRLSQEELVFYYKQAKIHILPSWFETCGLSSLEAAVMGCNVIVTDRGYTREYFENYAIYCDPASPASILEAVRQASVAKPSQQLCDKILNNYTWQLAASRAAQAYKQMMQAQWD